MLRLLGRRAVSASAELTSIHQCRIRPRTDSKPGPFRAFRGLQKGFCVGVLPDGVDKKSEAFSSNSIAMEGILSELRSHITKVLAGGGVEAEKRNKSRNKLLPRERIDKLLDPGSSFLELSQLAGHELYEEPLPSGGIITGIGPIHGHLCMFMANDPTVKGGTYYPITIKKHLRAQEIAARCRLPCLYLVDSGGAYLPRQAEVFPDKENFGRVFYNESVMSSQGIPQIAIVLGSCTAGGAYIPAMADESVMVKGNGTIFLAGPPLVKAATGEVVSAEDLGGATVHCNVSGVSDYFAQDEMHGLAIGRNIVKILHMAAKQGKEGSKSVEYKEPLYDKTELRSIAPVDHKQQFDVRSIIARIVDGSEFDEFKKQYGTVPKITIITGASFGAGNYAMCGRAFSPDFMFMWPNARIGIMGGPQAAGVLSQIERATKKRQGVAKHAPKEPFSKRFYPCSEGTLCKAFLAVRLNTLRRNPSQSVSTRLAKQAPKEPFTQRFYPFD
ncbi:hypothetical protein Bca101_015473 [Brassica carinata]